MIGLYERRHFVYALLSLLLVGDLLFYFLWIRNPGTAPEVSPAQIAALEKEVASLEKEVGRLRAVQSQVPQLRGRLDEFAGEHFIPSSSGFSAIASDLQTFSSAAGIDLKRVSYSSDKKQKRTDVEQIEVSTTIEGPYANLLRYLQQIEQAPHFYFVKDLEVSSTRSQAVRVDLRLTTYLNRAVL